MASNNGAADAGNGLRLTPNERRIYALLCDGQPHTHEEILPCLFDDLSSTGAVKVAVCRLRYKLEGVGMTISSSNRGVSTYRLARFLDSPYTD